MRGGRHRELDVDDARLDRGDAVPRIDLEDAVEPGQHEEHGILVGERPAREPGARAPGHERHPVYGE